MERFIPPVPTETANRTTGSDEEAIEVVEHVLHVMHDVVGADIGRDGGSGDEERGEAGTESVDLLAPGSVSDEEAIGVAIEMEPLVGVRCWI